MPAKPTLLDERWFVSSRRAARLRLFSWKNGRFRWVVEDCPIPRLAAGKGWAGVPVKTTDDYPAEQKAVPTAQRDEVCEFAWLQFESACDGFLGKGYIKFAEDPEPLYARLGGRSRRAKE